MSLFYEPLSIRQRIFLISQGLFQFLLAVFVTSTVWIMIMNRNWELVHTWHIFLSTTGFSFWMASAISLFNPGNTFVLGSDKLFRVIGHGTLLFIGTISVVVGICIKIQDKTNNNFSHFTSTHGILGLTSLILVLIAFTGGFIMAVSKFLQKPTLLKPVWMKNIHVFLGISAYLIGTVCLGYGIRDYFSDVTVNTRIGLVVILALCTGLNLLGPSSSLYNSVFS